MSATGIEATSGEVINTGQSSPETVFQSQLDAYNTKDLETLLNIYAPDTELFEHPNTLVAHGTEALWQRFHARFQEPNLHATLLHRTVLGQMMIDYEAVTRPFPEGLRTLELVMIYEVQEGRIKRCWIMAGRKTLFPSVAP